MWKLIRSLLLSVSKIKLKHYNNVKTKFIIKKFSKIIKSIINNIDTFQT